MDTGSLSTAVDAFGTASVDAVPDFEAVPALSTILEFPGKLIQQLGGLLGNLGS